MKCGYCQQELGWVHGHGACLNNRCALFGQNIAPCCDGETISNCPVPNSEMLGGTRSSESRLPVDPIADRGE